MRVELWFPTPILLNDVDPAVRDATHAKVMAYLESEAAKRDVTPSPEESVVTSYYKPEKSILADAKLTELEKVIFETANAFIQGIGLPPRPLEIERAWLNVFQPGAQEHQHSHDGSLLSCSYYVEAPEHCGDIVFPDPIGERRSYRAFTKTHAPTYLTGGDVSFAPQPGRLIMFESWLEHRVHCNKSDKVRISLAFNLREAR
jgi:uncharacterized protein (TIGR02466 family)